MPKRSLIVIPVLIVMLVASIGVIYALYSDFVTDNNDTEPRYVTITPQGVTTTSGMFNKTIKYNTHINITTEGRTVTYSLDPNQITSITVSGEEHNVILIGEATYRIEQVGGSDDYTFEMVKTAGTMTGTFYTALATSEDDTEYSAWVNSAFNNTTGVSYADIDSDVEYIKLRLYVDTSFQPNNSALAPMPMQNATFNMKVTIDD